MSEEQEGTVTSETEIVVDPPTTTEAQVDAAPEPEVAPEEPAFTPEWSYEFAGKKQEIPEHWRTVVKDEQTYKELVETLQSREALPKHKQRAEELEQKYSEAEPVLTTVNKLKELFNAGEHERVLEAIGYDKETLKNVVREMLKREQMPTEVQAIYDEKKRLAVEKERIEAENSTYRERNERELVSQTDFQLESELGKPEYTRLKDVYERSGGPGSFKQFVVQRGSYMVNSLGRHVTPSELLATIAKEYAPFMSVATPQSGQVAKKSVPTVTGSGGSPAQKGYGSVEDLKKKYKQLVGEED
jgi:hypothetical protein